MRGYCAACGVQSQTRFCFGCQQDPRIRGAVDNMRTAPVENRRPAPRTDVSQYRWPRRAERSFYRA
jgi:hypothetical protein